LAIYPGFYDDLGVGLKDWSRFIHAKQAARDIVAWFDAHYDFCFPEDKENKVLAAYPAMLLSMSVTIIRYIEKSNRLEEEDGEQELVDSSAPIEATLYEVLEVLADNRRIRPLFETRETFIDNSFDYGNLLREFGFSAVEYAEYDPPSMDAKPDLEWQRFELIQEARSNGTWPVPRLTVDEFLGRDEVDDFPFNPCTCYPCSLLKPSFLIHDAGFYSYLAISKAPYPAFDHFQLLLLCSRQLLPPLLCSCLLSPLSLYSRLPSHCFHFRLNSFVTLQPILMIGIMYKFYTKQ
jgi:hypothetical protein